MSDTEYEREILKIQLENQNHNLQQVNDELHNNIGQLLSVARINLNILESDPYTPAFLKGKLSETSELLSEVIGAVRLISKGLETDFIKSYGLVEVLSYEMARIRQGGKFETDLIYVGDIHPLPFDHNIVLLRVSQEFFNNSIKYAQTGTLKIAIAYLVDKVSVTLRHDHMGEDRGAINRETLVQFAIAAREIKRRVAMIKGYCLFDLSPNQHVQLTIETLSQKSK